MGERLHAAQLALLLIAELIDFSDRHLAQLQRHAVEGTEDEDHRTAAGDAATDVSGGRRSGGSIRRADCTALVATLGTSELGQARDGGIVVDHGLTGRSSSARYSISEHSTLTGPNSSPWSAKSSLRLRAMALPHSQGSRSLAATISIEMRTLRSVTVSPAKHPSRARTIPPASSRHCG